MQTTITFAGTMYLKRLLPAIVTVILLAGCSEEQEERSPEVLLEKMEQDYLGQIARLGILDLYEEVKWRLYCNHCDVPVKNCMGRELPGVTYGMLDLKVFYLKYENGKGELAYTFIYDNSMQCSLEDVPGNKIHGIGFVKDGIKPLYYISAGEAGHISIKCDTMADISECPTRMINPDQPVVRKFLLKNRNKLNPWFHMQAVKRGFLPED